MRDDIARSSAKAVIGLLQRAVRVRRTYGQGNRIIEVIGERLNRKLGKHLRRHGRLEVFVRRGELHMDGEPLFDPDNADPVAEQLFRDGVRMFALDGRIDDDGVAQFCDLLAEAMTPGADEDVVTLLWGREIVGLHMEAMEFARDACGARTVVSPYSVERSLRDLGISGPGPGSDVPAARPPAGPVAAPLQEGLREPYIERLRRGVEVLAGLWAHPEAGQQAAAALAGPVLESGDVALARRLFSGARQALHPDLLCELYSADRVQAFLEALPEGLGADLVGCIEVLTGCGPNVLDRLITLHRRAAQGDEREGLGRLIAEVQRDDPERLLARFRTAGPDDVAPLLGCLVLLHPPTASSELRRRLRPGADDVVIALLGALQEWPQVYSAEVRAASIELGRESGPIRAAAAHLFRLNDDQETGDTLLYWVQQEGFRGAPQREQEAILRALVRIDGEAVTPLLRAMIEPPSRKVTSPMSLRVAAARALGESNDAEALRVLQRARDAGDPSLADAALRSIARVAGRHRTGDDLLARPALTRRPADVPGAPPADEDGSRLDPEEVAAVRRRQELGAALVVALAAGLRAARLYDADNEAIGRLITNLSKCLQGLWHELSGELSVLTDDGVFFLGTHRLRLGAGQLAAAKECAAHLLRRYVGGLVFTAPPDEQTCRTVLSVLSPAPDAGAAEGAPAVEGEDLLERHHRRLAELGCETVGLLPPQEGLSEADRAPSRARALAGPYSATINAVSSQLSAEGGGGRSLGVRRAAYAMVDSCLRDFDGFRHLAGIVPARHPEAGRVMRVACIAMLVAARAGMARRELADVALSALLRSLGAAGAGPSRQVADMIASSVAEDGRRASPAGLLRAVVAWECRPEAAADGLQPQHPLSSLIALADSLDRALVDRAWVDGAPDGQPRPLLPALAATEADASGRYAQAVSELLGPFDGGAPISSTVIQ